MNYYYLENNILKLAKNYVVIGNKLITNPTEVQYNLAKCYPKSTEPIPEIEGKVINRLGWELVDNVWVEKYEYVDIPPISAQEVDFITENYLREVRCDRGYTSREPDAYTNSSNERWRQDAIDWIIFRDKVIEYSISIMESLDTNPITESEYKMNLPQITWTIN